MIHFHIVTLFPDALDSYLTASIIKRAQESKKIQISFYNPKDFEKPKKGSAVVPRIDDKPYGGGPGMVLRPEPMLRAVEKAIGRKDRKSVKVLWFSPGGEQFSTQYAEDLKENFRHIVLLCGRYEGIDERVREITGAESLSIGPYTLTGGELPAMVVLDAVSRRVPGVLGSDESVEEKRAASSAVYTRPEELTHKGKKYAVPEVLRSGNHAAIEQFRRGEREKKHGGG